MRQIRFGSKRKNLILSDPRSETTFPSSVLLYVLVISHYLFHLTFFYFIWGGGIWQIIEAVVVFLCCLKSVICRRGYKVIKKRLRGNSQEKSGLPGEWVVRAWLLRHKFVNSLLKTENLDSGVRWIFCPQWTWNKHRMKLIDHWHNQRWSKN